MKKGHGQINIGRRGAGLILVHRASYAFFKGPIPKGKCVCHSCDVPNCVNPKHLFIGSIQDNNADMIKKGRNAKGESSSSKLCNNDIKIIRNLARKKVKQRTIAEMFDMCDSAISNIINYKSWAHVTSS